jgi:hypothetical protein
VSFRGLTVTAPSAPRSELDESDFDPAVAHGTLPQAVRRAVRAAAIHDVVLPCARALLDRRAVAA